MTKVSIRIPNDAEPGDSLSFSVDAQPLEIEVPPGSQPGDILEIEVGGDRNSFANNERDSTATGNVESDRDSSIELSSGVNLVVCGELPMEDTSVCPSTVETDDDKDCDGTHAMAWPAGRALVNCLSSPAFQAIFAQHGSKSQSVIEVGSGLGLVGLAFAHAISQQKSSQQSTTKQQVFLSDVPAALPLLNHNIQLNHHLIAPQVQVTAVPLLWTTTTANTDPKTTANGSNTTSVSFTTTCDWNWIIGADVLYNHANIPALVATLERLMGSVSTADSICSTRILLAIRWRKPDLERTFFSKLNRLVNWSLVEDSCRPCSLAWQEYGNPACEASNRYFSQTMVGVQGVPTSLAEIDEASTERMTSDEFQAWERLQIQIYLGQAKSMKRKRRESSDS